jgi:hypothetical protein
MVETWLREKYRVVSPKDLEDVVNNYLAQLPKLGVSLVYRKPQVGVPDDEVSDTVSAQQADRDDDVDRANVSIL